MVFQSKVDQSNSNSPNSKAAFFFKSWKLLFRSNLKTYPSWCAEWATFALEKYFLTFGLLVPAFDVIREVSCMNYWSADIPQAWCREAILSYYTISSKVLSSSLFQARSKFSARPRISYPRHFCWNRPFWLFLAMIVLKVSCGNWATRHLLIDSTDLSLLEATSQPFSTKVKKSAINNLGHSYMS